MNNIRRKQIAAIMEQLEALREEVETLQEEEQEAFDNLPEGIQMSERGESMEEAAVSVALRCAGVFRLTGGNRCGKSGGRNLQNLPRGQGDHLRRHPVPAG